MRLILSSEPLPRCWSDIPNAKGIILENDLGVGHGKLRAKLLVFDSTKSLRHFWRLIGKGELGRQCAGAVNGLYCEIQTFAKEGLVGTHLEADPRYFCVIGLVKSHLSMEVISHEAVHAGFAYAKRKSRSPWDGCAKDFDEEAICYPSGRIAAAINRALYDSKLYAPV